MKRSHKSIIKPEFVYERMNFDELDRKSSQQNWKQFTVTSIKFSFQLLTSKRNIDLHDTSNFSKRFHLYTDTEFNESGRIFLTEFEMEIRIVPRNLAQDINYRAL